MKRVLGSVNSSQPSARGAAAAVALMPALQELALRGAAVNSTENSHPSAVCSDFLEKHCVSQKEKKLQLQPFLAESVV